MKAVAGLPAGVLAGNVMFHIVSTRNGLVLAPQQRFSSLACPGGKAGWMKLNQFETIRNILKKRGGFGMFLIVSKGVFGDSRLIKIELKH